MFVFAALYLPTFANRANQGVYLTRGERLAYFLALLWERYWWGFAPLALVFFVALLVAIATVRHGFRTSP